MFNAKDWALMKKWNEDGIPLPVVLEAIESVFDKNEAKGSRKVISSLSYCRHAVKELWADRKELQVGAQESSPEANPEPLLESLAGALESAHELIAAFAPRVRALAKENTVPRIEEKLIELEEELIETILRDLPDADAMREEARALSASVPEKTRARTEAANLRRIVRARYEIPRLSLF